MPLCGTHLIIWCSSPWGNKVRGRPTAKRENMSNIQTAYARVFPLCLFSSFRNIRLTWNVTLPRRRFVIHQSLAFRGTYCDSARNYSLTSKQATHPKRMPRKTCPLSLFHFRSVSHHEFFLSLSIEFAVWSRKQQGHRRVLDILDFTLSSYSSIFQWCRCETKSQFLTKLSNIVKWAFFWSRRNYDAKKDARVFAGEVLLSADAHASFLLHIKFRRILKVSWYGYLSLCRASFHDHLPRWTYGQRTDSHPLGSNGLWARSTGQ